jgi:dUTP pyrophosphatase
MDNKLLCKRLSDIAIVPHKCHSEDAGYILHSCDTVIIQGRATKIVSTGLAVTVPSGTYGRIAPLSGCSTKLLHVNSSVIDRGYSGLVKVSMYNASDVPIIISLRDRVAQLILEEYRSVEVMDVDVLEPV